MSRGIKAFNILLILLFVIGVVYFVKDEFRQADEGAELSCLSSIAAAVGSAQKAGKIQLETGTTRELTKQETESLLVGGVGDCGRHKGAFDQVHIAIGNVNSVSLSRIRVWTNGRDGVSGTSDDLVIPWEENHPK